MKRDYHTYGTTRIWEETLRNLRLVAALTGERMVEVLHRLVLAELERIRDKGVGQ